MIFQTRNNTKIDLSSLVDIKNLTSVETNKIMGIYLIVNFKNNKIYIGQAVNVRNRWLGHCQNWSRHQQIDKAIKKYGSENFGCYLLERVQERSNLNSREYYWASMYKDCYIPYGYNVQICGNTPLNLSAMIEVSCYNDSGNKIETFKSISEAVAKYSNGVANVIKPKNWYHKVSNLYWREGHQDHIDLSEIQKLKTGPNGGNPVYMYDMNTGDFLAEFKSDGEAARNIIKDITASANINSCCNNRLYYAYNYLWSRIKADNIFIVDERLRKFHEQALRKQVSQYSLDGQFISTYASSVEAGRATGINIGNIGKCCAGLAKTTGGYIWKYTNR